MKNKDIAIKIEKIKCLIMEIENELEKESVVDDQYSIDDILHHVCKFFNVSLKELSSGNRQWDIADIKHVYMAYVAINMPHYSSTEVASKIKVSRSMVSVSKHSVINKSDNVLLKKYNSFVDYIQHLHEN
jgi:chromosomal replication initiation ATPase DnaA